MQGLSGSVKATVITVESLETKQSCRAEMVVLGVGGQGEWINEKTKKGVWGLGVRVSG